jgi:hypothetical protein
MLRKAPDQTKRQKQEEMEMKAEAVRRNRDMPSEDRSKNLAWLVVGPRGDKRLIKRYVCLEMERREGGDRARGHARGSNRRSMTQNKGPSMATGANLTTLGHEEVTDCEEMEEGKGGHKIVNSLTVTFNS